MLKSFNEKSIQIRYLAGKKAEKHLKMCESIQKWHNGKIYTCFFVTFYT